MKTPIIKQFVKDAMASVAVMLFGLLACFVISLLTGCTTTKYVPVESTVTRTDTVTHYINSTDSVTVIEHVYESDTRYDSIAPILDSLNRVIGFDRWHFRETTKKDSREIARLQSFVDSLKAVKRDSIDRPVPYPVERELTKWEQTKMDFGGMAIGMMIVMIVVSVLWLVKKFRK